MKEIVIVGAGSAGVIAASMMYQFWGNKVNIKVYYDSKNKSIGVGESTTPGIVDYMFDIGIPLDMFLKRTSSTLKLGIHFKNWIKDTDYFHGVNEIESLEVGDGWHNTISLYSLLNDVYNGGVNFNKATTTIPDKDFEEYETGLHIDQQEFANLIMSWCEPDMEFIDDVVEKVNVKDGNIESIECNKSGIIKADLFVDATGFSRTLIKNLNPEWIDISKDLPLNRSIPQTIENKGEIPSYTLSEATDNGWIWGIPVGDTYRTGYIYSSKFISDEEAKEKYNSWLLENFNTNLISDNIISFDAGYYKENFIGNCYAIGLAAGFIEPLEALGIQFIIGQVEEFVQLNSSINNLQYSKNLINVRNKNMHDTLYKFVALHYATDRTDSDFWKYMTNNRIQWVKDFVEKCRVDFIDVFGADEILQGWVLDSYIQVCKGINLFDKKSIESYINSIKDSEEVLSKSKEDYEKARDEKSKYNYISHRKFLESLYSERNSADKEYLEMELEKAHK